MENIQSKKRSLDDQTLQDIYRQSQDCNLSTSQVLQANKFLFQKDYDVLDIIACGKYSVVFKAFSLASSCEVAIKVQTCRNQIVLKELQNQFNSFQNNEDTNLLKIHQICYDDQTELLYVVMDLCVNGDLYHFVRRDQGLDIEIIYSLTAQLIRSVLILHQQNIIHGDINPSNFLIDSSFMLKISYQGASKFLYNTLKHAFYDPFTIYYSSKEQLDKQIPSAQSDLYSLGVVLLDLIGLRVESQVDDLIKLQSRNVNQLILLKSNIENKYHLIFEIALNLISNINNNQQILNLDQSVSMLQKCYNKIISIQNNNFQDINIHLSNDISNSKINENSEMNQHLNNQQTQNSKQNSTRNNSFLYFLLTNTQRIYFCFYKNLKKLILYFVYFITLLLNSFKKLRQNKNQTNSNSNFTNTMEDKSVQTLSNDDSQNCTPAYRKSKFFDNKLNQWSTINSDNSKPNYPIEYEITTQYLDTEDDNLENSKQNEAGNNKFDLDNLPSSESDISLDEIIDENAINKDSQKAKGQKTFLKQQTTNDTLIYSQSDSTLVEKNIQQRERKSSQVNSSQIQSKASQQDIVFFPNGYYIGEVCQKVPHGLGKMYFHKGNRYEGSFVDGLYEGKGTYYYLGGNKYTGEWKNNLREGHGMYKWANGTIYIGEYLQNAKNGKGTLKFSNGERYDGYFKDNNFDGKGTYYYTDGVRYEGHFQNGKAINGQFYLANGQKSDVKNFRKIPDHKKHINTI